MLTLCDESCTRVCDRVSKYHRSMGTTYQCLPSDVRDFLRTSHGADLLDLIVCQRVTRRLAVRLIADAIISDHAID